MQNGACEQWEIKLFTTLKVLKSRVKRDVSKRPIGCERWGNHMAQHGVKLRQIRERPTCGL